MLEHLKIHRLRNLHIEEEINLQLFKLGTSSIIVLKYCLLEIRFEDWVIILTKLYL